MYVDWTAAYTKSKLTIALFLYLNNPTKKYFLKIPYYKIEFFLAFIKL